MEIQVRGSLVFYLLCHDLLVFFFHTNYNLSY